RGLQGAWNFSLWQSSTSKPGLPTGFDPATYTSLAIVGANLVNVAVLPFTVANLALQGQWDMISPTITTTTTTFFTSLTRLPTSFAQTLNWVFTGNPPTSTMAAAATVDSLQANQVSLAAATDPSPNNIATRALQGA